MSYSSSWGIQLQLWKLAWFWFGINPVFPLLFPEKLYWVSAANTLVTVILGLLFVLFNPFRFVTILSKNVAWIFAYLSWIIFSTAVSPYAYENLFRSAGFLTANFFWILIVLIGTRWFELDVSLVTMGRAYVLGAIIITFVLLASNLELSGRFGNEELLHPNSIGVMYGIALCFIIFMPLYKLKLLTSALGLSFVLLLFLTFSKTSLISLAIAVAVGVLFQRGLRKARFFLGGFIAGIVVILLLGDFIQQQTMDYFGDPSMLTTLTGRKLLWGWTLETVQERPWFGYGYATFRDIFITSAISSQYAVPMVHPHNAYFDALFAGGYIGLILFSIWLFKMTSFIKQAVIKLRGSFEASCLISIATFIIVRSATEGALNLGRDFTLFCCIAFLSEAWLLNWAFINSHENSHQSMLKVI